MKSGCLVAMAIATALNLTGAIAVRAQEPREAIEMVVKDYINAHPDEISELVKAYLVKHPEATGEILAAALKNRNAVAAGARSNAGAVESSAAQSAPDRAAAIGANAQALFSSRHQVTLGNPHGDVTLVEFFDYSCGFCKRALSDTLVLLKEDPNLKIVLKEFPILGPGSVEAARIAVAVRMQDDDGRKYIGFHRELLASAGPASKDKALAAASKQGFDIAAIERDAASEEATATINEDIRLASELGINGTPTYVIGGRMVRGAVGVAALKGQIDAARAAPANSVKAR
jgi:protein-disulfide isomerase